MSPCLVSDAAAAEKIPPTTFCAALDRPTVEKQMMLAYGKPAHHCLKNNESLARSGTAGAARLRVSGATLRITGPVSDGFWVRALVVMSQAAWATRFGLPVSIAYRSSQDAYLDALDQKRDGWTQFFEPLAQSVGATEPSTAPSRRHRASGSDHGGSALVQLDCYAAARAWEAYSNYAPNFRAATMQRRARIHLARTLPIEPRRAFRQAANSFWHARGLDTPNRTLGVHLRGTDKPGGVRRGVGAFVPLIRAYLCAHPHARVFVATDDERLLAEMQTALSPVLPPTWLVWRSGVLRGNSSLNPGFHAEELKLNGHPSLANDVLLDTLLLSKCDFILKSISSVSEFAIYWSPRLHENSYDVQLRGQPRPEWANAQCEPTRLPSAEPHAASPPPAGATAAELRDADKEAHSRDLMSDITSFIGQSTGGEQARAAGSSTPPWSTAPVAAATPIAPLSAASSAAPSLVAQPETLPASATAAMAPWRSSRDCPRLWVNPNGGKPMRMFIDHGPSMPSARLLGVTAGPEGASESPSTISLPPEGECSRLGEQGAFAANCAQTIEQMDRSLAALRGRRGLVFEYVGRSVWGVGHVLTFAYALHQLCRMLDRFCYVRLWDSQLDDVFVYANGASWAPTAEELARYPAPTVPIELSGQSAASSLTHLYARLHNETAPLVHATLTNAIPMVASEAIPWLLPLHASPRAASGVQSALAGGSGAVGSLDRCFCRYVSQPKFGRVGAALAAAAEKRMRAAAGGGLAIHLRTGQADMPDHEVRKLAARKQSLDGLREAQTRAVAGSRDASGGGDGRFRRRAGAAGTLTSTNAWLYGACGDAALRKLPPALVMSDAPGLVSLLLATYPQMFAVGRLNTTEGAAPSNGAPAAVSSRSWGNAFEPKLAAVIDVVAAGVASEVLYSRYSSMLKPAIARSMCIRRITPFDHDKTLGICPQFETVFVRNLQILIRDSSKYVCLQRQLESHPCKGLSGHACRDLFITAML